MKFLRNTLQALILSGVLSATVSALAQSTLPRGIHTNTGSSASVVTGSFFVSTAPSSPPPEPNGSPTSVTRPENMGPVLKAILDANRDTLKGLVEQRKALLEQLKNATPEQRDAIRAQLQSIMLENRSVQRELAKTIRDAIKARRDQARGANLPGGG